VTLKRHANRILTTVKKCRKSVVYMNICNAYKKFNFISVHLKLTYQQLRLVNIKTKAL